MACITKFVFTLVVFLFLAFMGLPSVLGCNTGQICSYPEVKSSLEIQSRKMLLFSKEDISGPTGAKGGKKLVVRELRAVPSGPDPLHHNGGTPNKKPRTP